MNLDVSQISDLKTEHPVSKDSIKKAFLERFNSPDNNFGDIMRSLCKMEEQMSQYQTITKAVFCSIKAAIYIKDVNLRYVKVNDYFKEIYNLPSDYSCIGQNDTAFFSKLEAEENNEEDKSVLQTGVIVQSREAYMPGTRKKKWALISKYPIVNNESKISGIVGSFVDITEGKENQVTNLILKRAIDQIKECIWIGTIKNNSPELKYINDAVENLTGFTKKEAMSISSIHLNTVVPEDRDKFQTFFNSKTYPKSLIFRIRRRTDNKLLTLKETIYSNGDLKFGVVSDVTDLKQEDNKN
ncbi:MAG: PAS domain-containing protein [Lentisphaerota bacterium]